MRWCLRDTFSIRLRAPLGLVGTGLEPTVCNFPPQDEHTKQGVRRTLYYIALSQLLVVSKLLRDQGVIQ